MKPNRFVAIALALLLCVPLSAQVEPSLVKKVQKIPNGSIVRVLLRNGESFQGPVSGVAGEGFRVRYARAEQVFDREITYGQVKKVSTVGSGQNLSGKSTVQEQAFAMGEGCKVKVRLADETTVRGWMGEASAEGFTLKIENGGGMRSLSYSQVRSINNVMKLRFKILIPTLIVLGVVSILLLVLHPGSDGPWV